MACQVPHDQVTPLLTDSDYNGVYVNPLQSLLWRSSRIALSGHSTFSVRFQKTFLVRCEKRPFLATSEVPTSPCATSHLRLSESEVAALLGYDLKLAIRSTGSLSKEEKKKEEMITRR